MYEKLFKRPHALVRHRTGPLAEERRRYLVHCADQHMSSQTLRRIAFYTLVVAKVLRLADRPDEPISRIEIDAAARHWVNRQPKPSTMRDTRSSRVRFVGQASRWLNFLGRLQSPTTALRPYTEQIRQFADYMLRERGLSPQTVDGRCRTTYEFLARIDDGGLRLDTLDITDIDQLLKQKIQDDDYGRLTARKYASNLRSFFRYAETRGWCRSGLAPAIMAPRVFQYEALPAGVPWDAVELLLTATQGDQRADIRDRALLMLLAIYGFRAGEIVSLRLENLDWQKEILSVPHNKRQKPRIYPLCRSVGDAVLRYLREARPRSARRELFLTFRAPFRPLSSGGLGRFVRQRLRTLNIKLPHYGPHALRHACATRLLEQGLSLKEIGDHLGHQLPETTRIYAKVDLAGLRIIGDFDLEGLL